MVEIVLSLNVPSCSFLFTLRRCSITQDICSFETIIKTFCIVDYNYLPLNVNISLNNT